LHEIALEYGGGLNGIRSQQTLASAIGQAEASAFGEDAYPTIPEKAAAYGFFIAEGQPVVDGNKRTALLAMETFLSTMVMSSRRTACESASAPAPASRFEYWQTTGRHEALHIGRNGSGRALEFSDSRRNSSIRASPFRT
jgi:hypothetical protein